VQDALSSIKEQSYRPIEIILIDDCSETPFFSQNLDDGISFKILRNDKNLGAGNSRIRGIKGSKGRFISFLDADDIWLPDKLSLQINNMLENSLCLSWTGYIFANKLLQYKGSYIPNKSSNYISFISKYFTIGCLTCVYDRKYLNDPSNAYLKMRNDYQMWFSLFSQIRNNPKLRASPIRKVTAIHRIHDSSLTSSKAKAAFFWWKYLSTTNHTILFRLLCYFCYFIFTIKLRVFKNKENSHVQTLKKLTIIS
jgi:glycosyltransferase involved in cell wall biosynthesis